MNIIKTLAVLCFLFALFQPPNLFAQSKKMPSQDNQLTQRCQGSPSVNQVILEALRFHHLKHNQAQSWRRRLAWSSLLPQLSTRITSASSATENMDMAPHRPDTLDLHSYLALRWEVRATWNLSKLLFDFRELSISKRASQLAKERKDLVEKIMRLYFERCLMMALLRRYADSGAELDLEDQIKLLRISATLDELTGGTLTKEFLLW